MPGIKVICYIPLFSNPLGNLAMSVSDYSFHSIPFYVSTAPLQTFEFHSITPSRFIVLRVPYLFPQAKRAVHYVSFSMLCLLHHGCVSWWWKRSNLEALNIKKTEYSEGLAWQTASKKNGCTEKQVHDCHISYKGLIAPVFLMATTCTNCMDLYKSSFQITKTVCLPFSQVTNRQQYQQWRFKDYILLLLMQVFILVTPYLLKSHIFKLDFIFSTWYFTRFFFWNIIHVVTTGTISVFLHLSIILTAALS